MGPEHTKLSSAYASTLVVSAVIEIIRHFTKMYSTVEVQQSL